MASKNKDYSAPFTIELNQFRTLNTKDSPVSMKDDELPILINFMPIGTTLYTIPGYSAAPLVTIGSSETAWVANTAALKNSVVVPTVANGFIYLCTTAGTTHATTEPTWPTTQGATVSDNGVVWTAYSSTIRRMFSLNLNGTLYWLVATTGGAIYLVTSTWTQVRLSLPGVFTDPKFEQWKYTNGLIIDPTAGYFNYPGVNAAINAPLCAIAGTATKVKTTNDIEFVIATTTYQKAATDNFWTLTGFNCTNAMYNSCYLYITTAGAAAIAAGTQATTLAGVVMPAIDTTKALIGTLTVHVTGIGNFTGGTTALNDGTVIPNAAFVDGLLLNPNTTYSAPTSGTCIAVFKSRVWIGNGRTLSYSAPDSLNDFTTGSAGGTVIDTYSSLRNQINALFSTADYLYIVGDHATHTIYGVQVFSSGSTAFNLIDSVPGVGSVFPEASQVLGGTIYETGDGGSNAVAGSDFQNFSAYLDGIFPSIIAAFSPVACWSKIYNKYVYCLLAQLASQIDGSAQKVIMCYYENRWFFVVYGQDFNFISQQATATDTTTYAAYSNKMIKIFSGTETSTTKKFRTKSLNYGDPSKSKQILNLGATLVNTSGLLASVNPVMTAIGTGLPDQFAQAFCIPTFSPGVIQWLNALGNVVVWTGAIWSAYYNDMMGMASCDGRGKRIQIDYEEISAAAYSVTGVIVQAQIAEEN